MKRKNNKTWFNGCQTDLINRLSELNKDYQLMNYQDFIFTFTILRCFKTKTDEERIYQFVNKFSLFGAPFILQRNDDREFSKKII